MDLISWFGYVVELLPGLWKAVQLTVISLALGYPLALLFAVLIDSKIAPIRWIILVLVEVGRGLPLLVLLYLFYQGLPQLSVVLSALASAVWAFTWSAAAYATEIIRSSLRSVGSGQREAANAIGLDDRDQFRYVILPQAARIAIPPLLGLAIIMFQLTSLAYVIAYSEVMQSAYFLGTKTFNYFPVFLAAAAVYASVTIPASALVTGIERRLSRHV